MKTQTKPRVSIIEYTGRGNLMMKYTPAKGDAVTRSTLTTDWQEAERAALRWAELISQGKWPK